MQHAADLNKSPMLKSIYNILSDLQWHTTKDLADKTGCVVVSTRISELRRNYVNIACQYVGKTDRGNKIYQYKMIVPICGSGNGKKDK